MNILILAVVMSLFTLFIFCLFGMLATESFEKMADSLYESKWIDLPVELQKNIIFMIADMQRPIYFHGFGMVNLDLVTLINVR